MALAFSGRGDLVGLYPAAGTRPASPRGEQPNRACIRRPPWVALPPELPPKYGEVLNNLPDRLESSAAFSGESCSISQDNLIAIVQAWIDKAREKLAS